MWHLNLAQFASCTLTTFLDLQYIVVVEGKPSGMNHARILGQIMCLQLPSASLTLLPLVLACAFPATLQDITLIRRCANLLSGYYHHWMGLYIRVAGAGCVRRSTAPGLIDTCVTLLLCM